MYFFNEILNIVYFMLLLTNVSDRQNVSWHWGNRIPNQSFKILGRYEDAYGRNWDERER
jgi:hypothetical protein